MSEIQPTTTVQQVQDNLDKYSDDEILWGVEFLEDFSIAEGDWVLDTRDNACLRINAIQDNGVVLTDRIPTRGVETGKRSDDAISVLELAHRIDAGDAFPISDGVIDHAEKTMSVFAQQELSRYLSTNGLSHPYRGIDQVSNLADLKAALFFATHSPEQADE